MTKLNRRLPAVTHRGIWNTSGLTIQPATVSTLQMLATLRGSVLFAERKESRSGMTQRNWFVRRRQTLVEFQFSYNRSQGIILLRRSCVQAGLGKRAGKSLQCDRGDPNSASIGMSWTAGKISDAWRGGNKFTCSQGINQNMVYELVLLDNPLLPISRTSFRAIFVPTTTIVPADELWPWPYIDQGRVMVLDLVQLTRELRVSSRIDMR